MTDFEKLKEMYDKADVDYSVSVIKDQVQFIDCVYVRCGHIFDEKGKLLSVYGDQ